MSLDIYLKSDKKFKRLVGSGIFIRDGGKTVEISEEEWKRRYPDREPVRYTGQADETDELYTDNITHNMGRMAKECGLYAALWEPEEHGWKTAADITEQLMGGYRDLARRPDIYKQYNPENGWGDYDALLEFAGNYLLACLRYPDATIEVSR